MRKFSSNSIFEIWPYNDIDTLCPNSDILGNHGNPCKSWQKQAADVAYGGCHLSKTLRGIDESRHVTWGIDLASTRPLTTLLLLVL